MSNIDIVCADVLDWCESYSGPKFHAILCDPSYALSKKKRLDMDAPVDAEIETVGDVIAAYHALQQWGDVGFMNREWDNDVAFNPETWRALARHLYPGGFVMAFASSRGDHRLAVAMEDAGLILHPTIYFYWVNGQGFPKATRIDTQIDKAAGKLEERKVIGRRMTGGMGAGSPKAPLPPSVITGLSNRQFKSGMMEIDITVPATDLARAWAGHRYGLQALKPAVEPIIVAQKPYAGRPVDCIVDTGAGALWIDGGRVNTNQIKRDPRKANGTKGGSTFHGQEYDERQQEWNGKQGRWPPNFALVHCPPHLVCQQCQAVHPIQPVIEVCDCGGELERVEGCKRVGVKRVKGDGHYPEKRTPNAIYGGGKGTNINTGWEDTQIKKETVADWDCADGCVVARLGEQSGESDHWRPSETCDSNTTIWHNAGEASKIRHRDKGTAARFYPQASWEHEEMECCEACPVARLDEQAGERKSGGSGESLESRAGFWGNIKSREVNNPLEPSSGGASRFYVNADWTHEVAEQLAMKAGRGQVVRLRSDLTEEQKRQVLEELQKAGVQPFG